MQDNPNHFGVAGHDEAAALAQSFAALLARLQGERAREQSFLAYAAHELRTPISALRAGLEAVQLGRTLPSPETCARFYRDALRLEGFAQNLLALARADAGEVRPAPLDLAALDARAVWQDAVRWDARTGTLVAARERCLRRL